MKKWNAVGHAGYSVDKELARRVAELDIVDMDAEEDNLDSLVDSEDTEV